MPNRPVHLATSGPVRALFSYRKAPGTNDLNRTVEAIGGWQQALRNWAEEFSRLRSRETDPLVAAWYAIAETALRLLSGLLAGFGAGYVMHVALDFTTPRCLPLIS